MRRTAGGQLDAAALKVILRESIFGIELDSGAVDLAAFSLALAVCDVLKPEVIWGELKFDQLRGRNLLEGDFFAEVIKARDGQSAICTGKFDIILGNPPFESDLTADGEALNREVASARRSAGQAGGVSVLRARDRPVEARWQTMPYSALGHSLQRQSGGIPAAYHRVSKRRDDFGFYLDPEHVRSG